RPSLTAAIRSRPLWRQRRRRPRTFRRRTEEIVSYCCAFSRDPGRCRGLCCDDQTEKCSASIEAEINSAFEPAQARGGLKGESRSAASGAGAAATRSRRVTYSMLAILSCGAAAVTWARQWQQCAVVEQGAVLLESLAVVCAIETATAPSV